MKQNIPGPVAVVVIIVVALIALVCGWRYLKGGPDADVTEENIQHYKQLANDWERTHPQGVPKQAVPGQSSVPQNPGSRETPQQSDSQRSPATK
jgi:hypothetical protein